MLYGPTAPSCLSPANYTEHSAYRPNSARRSGAPTAALAKQCAYHISHIY
jgi:hypothetical protein